MTNETFYEYYIGLNVTKVDIYEFDRGITPARFKPYLKKYSRTTLDTMGTLPFKTSFTEKLLRKSCEFQALLIIDASGLTVNLESNRTNPTTLEMYLKGGPSPYCNHAVFLEDCDFEKNAFRIWSWDRKFYVTKELLIGLPINNTAYTNGMVCSAQGIILKNTSATTSDN